MRAIKILLVAFFITALVAGYIIYNSGMSLSFPSGTGAPEDIDTVEQNGLPDDSCTEGATGPSAAAEPERSPSLPAVRRVHELFMSLKAEDEEGFNDILALLPDIDWSVYSKEYGATGDNGLGAVELLEWLTENPRTMQGDNMLGIFRATKGLDGVMAEQYSVMAGNFYRADIERFVELLARLDEQSIDRVCYHTAYNNYYHFEPEEAIEAINARFEGRALSEKERYVVDTMVKSMEAYITKGST